MADDMEIDEQESGRNPLRDHIKRLEAENAELKAKESEAAAAKRELAFVKAGVDPTSPAAKYFVKAYDGDLTPDAIKAAAVEAMIIKDTKSNEQVSEQAAWGRSTQVAAGAGSEPPVDWLARINSAKNEQELTAILSQYQQSSNP